MFVRAALLLALALPASASAGTLGEIAPLQLRGSEDCAGATGAPGELIVATKTGVRFVTATREGFRLGQALELGANFECQAYKVRPNGAGVIVGDVNGAVVAAVRDPGGTWSAPTTLSKTDSRAYSLSVSADVSDRGDVIVAYRQTQFDEQAQRFKVVRRAAGGTFGAEEQIGPASEQLADIVAGIAATGEAFVVTSSIANHRAPLRVPVEVRVAPPSGAFGAPVHLADTRFLTAPALGVDADGRALVAVAAGTSMVVAERAPGEGFSAPTPIGSIGDGALAGAEITLGPGGTAAIAWLRLLPFDLQLVSRAAPGAFSSPVVAYDAGGLVPSDFDPFYFSETYFASLVGLNAFSSSDSTASLALTPDGRVAFGIADGTRTTISSVPLAGGPPVTARSGKVFGTSGDGTTLLLADGTPAVAWTESATGQFGGLIGSADPYRLHLAAEGVTELADPPAPRVTVGAPVTRTIGQKGLRLPITCSAACQVVADIDSSVTALGQSVRMTRAGRRTLVIGGVGLVAPERLGPVRVHLRYGALGALHPRERTVTVRVKRAAALDVPRLSGVRAHRVGDRIRVTFRLENGSYDVFVSGDDTRGWSGEPLVTRTVTTEPGRRDYAVTLPAKGVKFVTVRVPYLFSGLSKTVVKVR